MGIPLLLGAPKTQLTAPSGLGKVRYRRVGLQSILVLSSVALSLACGPARQPEDQHLGTSLDVADAPEADAGPEASAGPPPRAESDANEGPEAPATHSSAPQESAASASSVNEPDTSVARADEPTLISLTELAEKEQLERATVRAAASLAQLPAPGNDLGLVMAVSQRASDLLWLLAIENRGEAPVELAAVPSGLAFTVTAPTLAAEASTPPPGKEPTPKSTTCGAPPTSLTAEDMVLLQPGQMLTYEFDPRTYCDDDDVLVADATVEPVYGFPLLTRKVWKKGGFVEEVQKQKAPFVAQVQQSQPSAEIPTANAPSSVSDETQTPPRETALKQLTAALFILDETYPLDAVSFLPEGADDLTDTDDEGQSDEAPPPREALSLTIRDMGTTSDPDVRDVTVSVRNTSGRSLRLFWRREHLTFEVHSETQETTCRLTPSDRAPDQGAYSYLSVGASRSYVTRLREACPKGTFDLPGTYHVSVRLDANSSGSEFGYEAYVGSAQSKTPAKFVVRGGATPPVPAMRVFNGRAN